MLDNFYKQNNCSCDFEKIQALEHQLQLFPNYNLPVDKRLKFLEAEYHRINNSFNNNSGYRSNSESTKKFSDIYKNEIVDNPIPNHLIRAQQLGITLIRE